MTKFLEKYKIQYFIANVKYINGMAYTAFLM